MSRRTLAAVQLLLLLAPAILFMSALVIRYALPSAQQVVLRYAGKVWTLWLLLIALPMVVLLTGGAALVRRRDGWLAATTVAAGGILAVVAVHMLMN